MKPAYLIAAAAVMSALPGAAHNQGALQFGAPRPPAAAQACVTCHGAQGEGIATIGAPRIAAQSQHYLLKQLESYVNGSRRSAVMEPIAKGLPLQIRVDLAAYYSQVDAPVMQRANGAKSSERGRELALVGDHTRRVQACGNCHGPGGVGEPPAIPYLAGLDPGYHATTLNAWKAGTRRNDAGKQMAVVASALSDDDINAVAEYYSGLTPPKPAPLQLLVAPDPRTKPMPAATITPAPTSGSTQPDVGVGQGAATGGGTQGEGGTDASKQRGPGPSNASKAAKAGTPTIDKPAPATRPANTGDASQGRAIIASGAYGCAGCHTIPGVQLAKGIVGPSLAGIAQRGFIAGQLPNRPDVMLAFLQDPPALVPRTGMPNVQLPRDEAQHIAAYLYTLRAGDAR